MSIATEAKVDALERRVSELETALRMFGTPIEFLSNVAQLELRIERLGQRSKPGPKPKDGANG